MGALRCKVTGLPGLALLALLGRRLVNQGLLGRDLRPERPQPALP
jgi:hypothetical protein